MSNMLKFVGIRKVRQFHFVHTLRHISGYSAMRK